MVNVKRWRNDAPINEQYPSPFKDLGRGDEQPVGGGGGEERERATGIPCKINLISFNPHSGSQFKPSREEKMIELHHILAETGCVVFLQLSRGDDQMAAYGQLGKPGEIQAPLLRVPFNSKQH
ncbi:unnamed protein product [Ilex paraguariensis]|uniref:Uncharacterized protein n=1 Tax=Ilex paraguariensis TaxID=185542 RepID=A0ABC8TRR7_9AQUA